MEGYRNSTNNTNINNKDKLKQIISMVNNWLSENRKVNIHSSKIIIQLVKHGIDFVGYFIKKVLYSISCRGDNVYFKK